MLYEFSYIPIILFLYFRTWKYNTLIDDHVPRDGYMYQITTERQDPQTYEHQRSILATIVNVGVFIATCSYIHYLFGWKAALLYSVFPLNVSGVAWTTGNYYMTTVLLFLAGYMSISIIGGIVGICLSGAFYGAMLNSTLSGMPFAVIASLYPLGWLNWAILGFFVKGKRFSTGIKLRKSHHDELNVEAGVVRPYTLLNVPKVIAYYIMITMFPMRLGFFHDFGTEKQYFSKRMLALSCTLCLLFFYWSSTINPLMCIWWIANIFIFSQFIIYGQFVTERYTYLSNLAWCVMLAQFIDNPVVLAIIGTLYFCKSLEYIPAWKHNINLFSYSVVNFPKAPENYVNMASYYLDFHRYQDALKPLLVAERLMPTPKFSILMNITNSYLQYFERSRDLAALPKAYEYNQKALAIAPKNKVLFLKTQATEIKDRIHKINRNMNKALKRDSRIILPE